jgi:hypothetical protein
MPRTPERDRGEAQLTSRPRPPGLRVLGQDPEGEQPISALRAQEGMPLRLNRRATTRSIACSMAPEPAGPSDIVEAARAQ